MPLLSIITITYNNAAGLTKTAQSVTEQTNKDFEWIIIDGASTDETREILKTTSANTIVSEPDRGIYDAMNKGIAKSNSDYLLFLNAGDCLSDSETTAHIVSALSTKPDFLYSDALEHNIDNNTKHLKPARLWHKIDRGMFTHHQAMIYKTSIIKEHKLQYDTNYQIAADYKLTLQYLKHCKTDNITYLKSTPICLFECGGVSQTQSTTGRNEQYKIRKEQKTCSFLFNLYVLITQLISWQIAKLCPSVYNVIRGKKSA